MNGGKRSGKYKVMLYSRILAGASLASAHNKHPQYFRTDVSATLHAYHFKITKAAAAAAAEGPGGKENNRGGTKSERNLHFSAVQLYNFPFPLHVARLTVSHQLP